MFEAHVLQKTLRRYQTNWKGRISFMRWHVSAPYPLLRSVVLKVTVQANPLSRLWTWLFKGESLEWVWRDVIVWVKQRHLEHWQAVNFLPRRWTEGENCLPTEAEQVDCRVPLEMMPPLWLAQESWGRGRLISRCPGYLAFCKHTQVTRSVSEGGGMFVFHPQWF